MKTVSRFGDKLEWLVLGLIIVAAASAVPDYALSIWRFGILSRAHNRWLVDHIGFDNLEASAGVIFGLILILPAPARAGIAIPKLRNVWWKVLLICGSCITLAAIFSSKLNMPQLRGTDHAYWMWLIGPPREDLVFAGFLFGKFNQIWPGNIARWLPIHWSVIISALYFSLWHAQNFFSMNAVFVREQMAFAFGGALLLGLTRQWTASIVFMTATHMTVNYIAWHS